jgi:hypothetical protein
VVLYLHSPNTPSWRGDQLRKKHKDNFTFYLRVSHATRIKFIIFIIINIDFALCGRYWVSHGFRTHFCLGWSVNRLTRNPIVTYVAAESLVIYTFDHLVGFIFLYYLCSCLGVYELIRLYLSLVLIGFILTCGVRP